MAKNRQSHLVKKFSKFNDIHKHVQFFWIPETDYTRSSVNANSLSAKFNSCEVSKKS